MVEQQSLTTPQPPPQSLQSAKEIHQFQHDVDELKSWMAEKEAVLGSEEDQDLHSIQTLLRQHQELQVRRRPSALHQTGVAGLLVPLTLGGGAEHGLHLSPLLPCC